MKLVGQLALASASLLALSTPAFAQSTPAPDATTPADNPAAEADADVPGQDIVVTARRRDESKQDVPLVVNAVTADQIGKLNIRNFEEVVKVVPGLTIQQNANGIGSTTTVRGVKFDVNASGNNGTVEYYLNDAPISAGFVLQSVFDIGQIELLRGPQGTLRGRASPSGSITVTTRRPDLNEVGGFVSGTGTGNGAINAQAAIGVPIIDDVLAVRIAGIVDNNDFNEVRSIYGGQNPFSRTRAIRASARLDPLDGLSVNFMYQRLQQKIRGYDQVESVSLTNTELGVLPSTPIAIPAPGINIPGTAFAGNTLVNARDRRAVSPVPRNITQDFEIFNGSVDWRFAGQRLVYVVNHATQRLQSQEIGDRADLFGPAYTGFSGFGASLAPLNGQGQTTDSRSRQQSHELRLQSDDRLFGMVDYVVGGLINTLDSPTSLTTRTPSFCLDTVDLNPDPVATNIQPCAFLPLGTYPAPSSFLAVAELPVFTRSTTREHSIFGNVTVHLGERTELSSGVRYIMYQASGVTTVGGVNVRVVPPTDYNAWIYTASAKHRFSDNLMVYASVGSSWRPPAEAIGNFSICPLTGALFTPSLTCADQNFVRTQPERSTSYEIGFKSDWLDRRLTLNATVFHQRFNNFVYRSPGAGAPFVNYSRNSVSGAFTQNVQTFNFIAGVPVEVTGVEAEASFKVSDAFDIGASFTYAVGKIKNGRVPCADSNNDGVPDMTEALPTLASFNALGRTIQSCVVNQRANDAPVFSGNVQAEYRVPVSDRAQGYLRGLFTYYGSSQGDPLNRFDQVDGYGLLDLFVGLRDPDGAWEVQAFAKNITNTYRVLSRTSPITQTVGFSNGQSANVFTNYRGVSSTAPREFGLNVRYAFGAR
jgi:iron complex outermembrane receptor protein